MIFKYHGYAVRQEDIVKQTFGSMVDSPAWGFHITEQLNRQYETPDGTTFDVTARVYDVMAGRLEIDNYDLIRALDQEKPLLIGTGSHAMVLTAVYYIPLPNGEPGPIVGAVVRDPWPGRGRRELSIQELRPHYVAEIEITGDRAKRDLRGEQRRYRCIEACADKRERCEEPISANADRCALTCDRQYCDRCLYALDEFMAASCDRACDRCNEWCDRDRERAEERCSGAEERCTEHCE
jgi:hypothetical protein